MGKRRAISISVLKWATTIAVGGMFAIPIYNQVRYGNYDRIPQGVINTLKENWKWIIGLPLLGGVVHYVLNRLAPRWGISVPGLVSIRP